MNEFQYIAAKSGREQKYWLPLWMHAIDTAETCRKFLHERVPNNLFLMSGLSDHELEKLVIFLGMTHDIGKAIVDFQTMIAQNIQGHMERLFTVGLLQENGKENPYIGKVKHDIAGEAILLSMGCPESIAAIVGAHHGSPSRLGEDIELLMEIYGLCFHGGQKEKWQALWREWIQESLIFAGYNRIEDLPSIDKSTQFLLSGLLSVCDQIASNKFFFPLFLKEEHPEKTIYPRRTDIAWKKVSFSKIWKPYLGQDTITNFRESFGFAPNRLQEAVLNIVKNIKRPGLLLIEAPMGGGKTESALSAAEILAVKSNRTGLYIGLPTRATASGIFPRIKGWAEKQAKDGWKSISLLHGAKRQDGVYRETVRNSNSIAEDMKGVAIHRWTESGRTGLLSDFATGTIDQFLMASLKRKFVAMRLLGLISKVSIIDECHAYDAYMNTYLDRCLTWLGRYGAPVILLSATLPKTRREALIKAYLKGIDTKAVKTVHLQTDGYPLLTWTDGDTVYQKSIPIHEENAEVLIKKVKPDCVYEMVSRKISLGGCAGIIVNTVETAQQMAEQFRSTWKGDVLLLHSRFTDTDRANIEAEILKRVGKTSRREDRDGLIVIGTQVLEQSLDIDFDIEVSQPCPMDLFLQRIGRLWRHKWRERPQNITQAECFLMTDGWPLDQGTRAVYDGWTMLSTIQAMPNRIQIPKDIPYLVEKVYGAFPKDMASNQQKEAEELYQYLQAVTREKEDKAEIYCLGLPAKQTNTRPMHGLLDTGRNESEEEAVTTVRDGTMGITAILLVLDEKGILRFPDWVGGEEIKQSENITQEAIDKILGQQIRLPKCITKDIEETIQILSKERENFVPWWKDIMELKEALPLVINPQGIGKIDTQNILYTPTEGLVII